MRILYLITRSELGGAQTHLLDLVRGYRDACELAVAAGEDDAARAAAEGRADYLAAALVPLSVPFHTVADLVQPIRPVRDVRALCQIVALIRKIQPDLIHAHTSKAGVLGRLAARLTGVPSVFTAHTWSFAEGTCVQWKLLGTPAERLASYCGRHTIAVSEANRRLALRNRVSSARKLVTIHNGIGDTDWRADPGDGRVPTLAMVARFGLQKDHRSLLEALAGIRAPFRLLLAGDGPGRLEMQGEVERLGLRDRTEFLGARTDIAQVLGNCQIFVLASHWEGFPITILEAMRAGLPVIASNVGGVSESVVDGETGLLVPPADAPALQRALLSLIENPPLRACMGRAGRARYEQHFTLDRMLQQTLRVYDTALGGRGASVPLPGAYPVMDRRNGVI